MFKKIGKKCKKDPNAFECLFPFVGMMFGSIIIVAWASFLWLPILIVVVGYAIYYNIQED